MAVERLIGVDFGTSTSVIRILRYENEKPLGDMKAVAYQDGATMVPTLVQRSDADPSKAYFGFDAQGRKRGHTTYHSFKMDLESADPALRDRARSLTQQFYKYLASQYTSQRDFGGFGDVSDKERTVISYPVKWSQETKNFMLETAKNAGFPNVTGMDEAQAAIQAAAVMSANHLQKHELLKNGEAANILLIDMGAGTTDLVLARYVAGDQSKTEALNTWPRSGEVQFGGREIDHLLQDFFREKMEPEAADRVFRIVGTDKFKIWKERTLSPMLADRKEVTEFSEFDAQVAYEVEYSIDRTAFETCLSDYLKQFPELVNGCLQNAGMSGNDVDLVIVTGGHSKWYFVNEMLCGKMPQFGTIDLPQIRENPARIIPIPNPQETVALGLAYSGRRFALSEGTADNVQDRKAALGELGRTLNMVKEQKREQAYEPAAEGFMMKFDPAIKAFAHSGQGTVVVGTIMQGAVKTGDRVYVCGGPGRSRIAQVKKIALHLESKNVTTARKGDCIAVLLSGISENDASGATYIASKPDDPIEPSVNPVMQYSDSKETKGAWVKDAAQKAAELARQAEEKKRQKELEEARRRAAEIMQIDPDSIPYAPESDFELVSSNGNYVIKKYLGSSSVVSIPPTIRGRKVVAISFCAFGGPTILQGNKEIEVLVIPDTVRSIGSRAFVGCFNLHTVIAHSKIEEIGEFAFWACDKLQKLDFGMGNTQPWHVTFPPFLKKIGASAFAKSISLNSDTYLKEVQLSKRTKVKNPLGAKTFSERVCAVFYYD